MQSKGYKVSSCLRLGRWHHGREKCLLIFRLTYVRGAKVVWWVEHSRTNGCGHDRRIRLKDSVGQRTEEDAGNRKKDHERLVRMSQEL